MIAVVMPQQGSSLGSYMLAKWHKRAGEAVNAGDALFSYETDKATFDEYATVSGTFLGAYYKEGDIVPCLAKVCAIGESINFRGQGGVFGPGGEATEGISAAKPGDGEMATDADELFFSPRARALAQRLCVDPAMAEGTGPGGRVLERDVMALPADMDAAAAEEEEPTQDIAPTWDEASPADEDPLTDAVLPEDEEAPAEYAEPGSEPPPAGRQRDMSRMVASFDAKAVLGLCAMTRERGMDYNLPEVTLLGAVLFAASRVLPRYGKLYSTAGGEGVNIAVQQGAQEPLILHDADSKALSEIARWIAGYYEAEDCGGSAAALTVCDMSGYGVEHFAPALAPEEACILGVCAVKRSVGRRAGRLRAYPSAELSITFDRAAVDDACAAAFLRDLRRALECFPLLLL